MLTKTRGTLTSLPLFGYDRNMRIHKNGKVLENETYPCYGAKSGLPLIGSTESLSYVLGPKTQPISVGGNVLDVPVFKPVTHTRVDRKFTPGTPLHRELQVGDIRHTIDLCGVQRSVNTAFDLIQLQSLGLCYDPEYLTGLVSAGIGSRISTEILNDQSLLGIDDGFNILSFIGELRDVRELPKLLTRWTKSDKDVSDKYLGVSFGVLPFASDITSIIKRLQNLGPSIDRWNDMARNAKTMNLHRDIPFQTIGRNGGSDKDPVWTNSKAVLAYTHWTDDTAAPIKVYVWHHHETKQKIKVLMHAYFVPYNIEPSLIDDLKREIWGVNKPLTAAWQLIPFSFVVDWFANIGELITAFESSAPLLKVRLLNCGYSVHVETEHTLSIGTSPGQSDLGKFTSKHEFYRRVPVEPSTVVVGGTFYGPLRFKQITPGQTVLGSALLHQLLR